MIRRFCFLSAFRVAYPRQRRTLWRFSLAAACLLPGLLPAQTSTSPQFVSHGEPTAEEQYLLQKLNRARMDPVGEGQRLAAWLRGTPDGRSVVFYYGTDANQVATDLAAFSPAAPLAFDPRLIAAARAHSQDLAPHNGLGPGAEVDPLNNHKGYDGSNPKSRVRAAGWTEGSPSENYDPGSNTLDVDHAGFLVDWGNPGFGHRENALAYQGTNVVGIGLATKPAGMSPFPLVVTEDFAGPNIVRDGRNFVLADVPAQLVGAAYRDRNDNGQYDVGEGMAGVTVTMDGGAYYTVTGGSGGYALPLVREDGSLVLGQATVRASGMPNGQDSVQTVTVNQVTSVLGAFRANVAWDVVTGDQDGGNGTATPPATLSGGGTVSRARCNAVKVLVCRPVGDNASLLLEVPLQYKGSAVAGVDYKALPATVTIPAGAESAKLKVKALEGNGNNAPATLTIKVRKGKGAHVKVSVTINP